MALRLTRKTLHGLFPTDILFQTLYWARVKSLLGCRVQAFDILSSSWEIKGDFLVLIQSHGPNLLSAYVPQGPEYSPDKENYGPFLEELSESLKKHLEPETAFIRYDLPWESRYARDIQSRRLKNYPEARVREMRMNIGTSSWNLKKASMDMTVASTMIVDIGCREDEILARMKPKTRYNIGLAGRKGVRIRPGSMADLPDFYRLYLQTAGRNGFSGCAYGHFSALFNAHLHDPCYSEVLFLLATHGKRLLAGAITAISGSTAHFLYGASSSKYRNLMGSHALHWESMRQARLRGCTRYDMGAVSPVKDPAHPFYGLHRFKTGFGGNIEIRSGSWDYPLSEQRYNDFQNSDSLARSIAG